MSTFLWVIFPYLCLATFVVGHWWRYRYDKFGWTTRSSQLYETRLLRWGSPLFHFGILGVVIGHIGGLLIPKSWTDALGISVGLVDFGEYTLVSAKRDPGQGIVWAAFASLIAGITITFYRPRRRVWARLTRDGHLGLVFRADRYVNVEREFGALLDDLVTVRSSAPVPATGRRPTS